MSKSINTKCTNSPVCPDSPRLTVYNFPKIVNIDILIHCTLLQNDSLI